MKLMLDVDGCLADWNTFFLNLLEDAGANVAACRAQLLKGEWPNCWHWPEKYFSEAHVEAAWQAWTAQPMLGLLEIRPAAPTWVFDQLAALADAHDLYFLTNRHIPRAKAVTERWLRMWGIPLPTVIPTPDKARLVQALGIEVTLDDDGENCHHLYTRTRAKVYLLAQPWNQPWRTFWGDQAWKGITVVESWQAFFEQLGSVGHRWDPEAGVPSTRRSPAESDPYVDDSLPSAAPRLHHPRLGAAGPEAEKA